MFIRSIKGQKGPQGLVPLPLLGQRGKGKEKLLEPSVESLGKGKQPVHKDLTVKKKKKNQGNKYTNLTLHLTSKSHQWLNPTGIQLMQPLHVSLPGQRTEWKWMVSQLGGAHRNCPAHQGNLKTCSGLWLKTRSSPEPINAGPCLKIILSYSRLLTQTFRCISNI